MPDLSVQQSYYVFLPNNQRHEIPLPFFWYYSKMKLIRISRKHSNVAHLPRGIRAFPDRTTGGLQFQVIKQGRLDTVSIPNAWRRLLSLSKAQDPDLYDDFWGFYNRISNQFSVAV